MQTTLVLTRNIVIIISQKKIPHNNPYLPALAGL